ncbi:UAA transporter [Trema orientale]|uniref:UAA transporter n=1 Tax=Trema orientale TaxID=63057 RepID=A0A2P5BUU3_TREOI|nr:UAA transporter [Trema orientale]
MAEPSLPGGFKENKLLWKGIFAVSGIMTTLVAYGVLQEKIMRVPYGVNKEFFKYSLFLVFCNRITTSAVSACFLLASKKALDPVAPVYKYCLVSVSNILTTTCQYEALKYVSFPVQTLAKCAKMIPVMVWGTIIMQKKYKGPDYFLAFLVTMGCSIFILYPAGSDISPYGRGRENTVWGVSLMIGYLGFDGFTSTFQDKLFKGYDMEIHNQIFYTTLCSCLLSLTGLILQGHLLRAVDFVSRHNDCFLDIVLLSTVSDLYFISSLTGTHKLLFTSDIWLQVATASQFFISYTIRTFGALTFATIMTTRQLVSILLSCLWFSHPLSWEQWIGAVIVFGSLYVKSFLRKAPQKPPPSEETLNGVSSPLKDNP